MPNLCCLKDCLCHNITNKQSTDLSFHKFPFEENRKQEWIERLRTRDSTYVHQKSHVLCSAHFSDSDFNPNKQPLQSDGKNNKMKRYRLKNEAVPSFFPPIKGEKDVDCNTNLGKLLLFPESEAREISETGMDVSMPSIEIDIVEDIEKLFDDTHMDEMNNPSFHATQAYSLNDPASDNDVIMQTLGDNRHPREAADISDGNESELVYVCPVIPEVTESHHNMMPECHPSPSEASQHSQQSSHQAHSVSTKRFSQGQSVDQCKMTSNSKYEASLRLLMKLEHDGLLTWRSPKQMRAYMSKLFKRNHNESYIKTDAQVYRPLIHHYIFVLLYLNHCGKMKEEPWICFCNAHGKAAGGPTWYCKILCRKEVAAMWGQVKNNRHEMTSDKFGRALRKSRDCGNFEKQDGSRGRGKGTKKNILRFSDKAFQELSYAFNW